MIASFSDVRYKRQGERVPCAWKRRQDDGRRRIDDTFREEQKAEKSEGARWIKGSCSNWEDIGAVEGKFVI